MPRWLSGSSQSNGQHSRHLSLLRSMMSSSHHYVTAFDAVRLGWVAVSLRDWAETDWTTHDALHAELAAHDASRSQEHQRVASALIALHEVWQYGQFLTEPLHPLRHVGVVGVLGLACIAGTRELARRARRSVITLDDDRHLAVRDRPLAVVSTERTRQAPGAVVLDEQEFAVAVLPDDVVAQRLLPRLGDKLPHRLGVDDIAFRDVVRSDEVHQSLPAFLVAGPASSGLTKSISYFRPLRESRRADGT